MANKNKCPSLKPGILIEKLPASKNIILLPGALLGWFAIIAQFYLIIINRTASLTETITRFFSFFTVLTNIIVALSFYYLLVKPRSSAGSFFAKPRALTAVASYIIVVGIVYNVVLRFLWQPQGLQRVVDEILHSVIPLLFLLYWLFFVPKRTLTWNILPWLIYPALYCIYTLIRGAIVGYYPYPFIDVSHLGYQKVVINIAGLVLLFAIISLLLVCLAKLTKRANKQ